MRSEDLIREFPKGLIQWYPFRPNSKALCICGEDGAAQSISESLEESGLFVDRISLEELESGRREFPAGSFQYIVAVSVLERAKRPKDAARELYRQLSEDGLLLLGAGNRLAVRYFCGERDPFTGRNFDGIENYRAACDSNGGHIQSGRNFSKAELKEILNGAGFQNYRFYSVFPDLRDPQILAAEDFTPTEELDVRIFPQYDDGETVFLEEEYLYSSLIKNGLFHSMANGFLIECPRKPAFSNVFQITANIGRGRKNALFTIIRRDNKVEKCPAYRNESEKIEIMRSNHQYLREHGVPMVDVTVENNALVMPYIDAEPLTDYFRRILQEDVSFFWEELERYWQIILMSSEHIPPEEVDWTRFDPWWEYWENFDPEEYVWRKLALEERETFGVILKRGFMDLVSLNGFYKDGQFLFYDQELYVHNLPAKTMLFRTIDYIYLGHSNLELILPKREVFQRYKLEPCLGLIYAFTGRYLNDLRNDQLLAGHYASRRADKNRVKLNRLRVNYTEPEYQKLFVDIFANIENKEVYLFGAGKYARNFLSLYQEIKITAILDNDRNRQGGTLQGIPIRSPSLLEGLDPAGYKVIICMKNYRDALKQAKELGAARVSVFDSRAEHPWRPRRIAGSGEDSSKKYHVGYVAGVFDLFHVGHLNLLRRAKEQCDYLIVGVVTDEGVRKNKRVEPVIPFEQRLAVVQACRYVDEAVPIPLIQCDTDTAYQKFQFDAQFSGSDYENDPQWLAKRDYLRERGAELVFFPYTEATSSSSIKAKLKNSTERG